MSQAPDGRIIEERSPTPVGDTGSVPAGTMLTVPAASPNGPPPTAPIVAVNTTPTWKDPQFLAAVGGAFLAVADPVIEVLATDQPFRWRPLILACILALVAWLRKQTNTVTS